MPSKTKKQASFMAWIAFGKGKKPKGAPSKEVAEEFVRADKGKKFRGLKSHG